MTYLHSLIRTCTSQVIDLVDDFISAFGIVINASFMECYKCFIYGDKNNLFTFFMMMYVYILLLFF